MKWLLETDIFDENLERLHEAILSAGHTFKEVKYIPFDDNEHISKVYHKLDVNVFFYGSLNLCKKVQSLTTWNTFCDLPKYECTYYYPRLKEFLVNAECYMLPFGMLTPKIFNNANTVFVRPSQGDKLFDGQLFGKASFDSQYWGMVHKHQTKPEDIVLISETKNIGKEWRLVVSDVVITGSQYKDCGSFVTGSVPKEVIDYSNNVLENIDYRPDKIWTLDVCETDHGLRVLEVGGLSCAGLYECDLDLIVKEVGVQCKGE